MSDAILAVVIMAIYLALAAAIFAHVLVMPVIGWLWMFGYLH